MPLACARAMSTPPADDDARRRLRPLARGGRRHVRFVEEGVLLRLRLASIVIAARRSARCGPTIAAPAAGDAALRHSVRDRSRAAEAIVTPIVPRFAGSRCSLRMRSALRRRRRAARWSRRGARRRRPCRWAPRSAPRGSARRRAPPRADRRSRARPRGPRTSRGRSGRRASRRRARRWGIARAALRRVVGDAGGDLGEAGEDVELGEGDAVQAVDPRRVAERRAGRSSRCAAGAW